MTLSAPTFSAKSLASLIRRTALARTALSGDVRPPFLNSGSALTLTLMAANLILYLSASPLVVAASVTS